MDLKHLPDIHTGRHAKRVQHDIQRPPVRQKRHILHRKDTRDNTLVPMPASHLIADGNLTFLGDIDADRLIYAR